MRLPLELGGATDGRATITLRDLSTVDEMHALTATNLDRLRRWEQWAQGDQTRDGQDWFTRRLVDAWEARVGIPLVLRWDGRAVGAVTATVDGYTGVAQLGYWIDRDAEGRGLVTRASSVVVDELEARGVPRVEIRAATGNARSRRVAERLGFVHEGTLRSAMQVGEARHDVAVYGRVRSAE